MTKYIIKRIIMIIPIVLGVIFVLFLMLHAFTGSRVRDIPIYGGGDALDSVFSFFNAGKNFFTQYLRYCYNSFVHLNLGQSSAASARLMIELSYRVRNTVFLLLSGVGVTLLVGIPLGAFSAVRKNSLVDRTVNIISLLFSSIPNYAIALLLTLVLCVYTRLLPILVSYTRPSAFLLPALTISLGGISSVARMTRAAMIEVLEQPYISALRAKGLRETNIIFRHALKNTLVPIISVLGGLVAQLLCGTLIVEYFFNVPGLGSFMLNSLGTRDHFAMLGCAVVLTIILSVTNIIADVLYAFVDPQIKLRYTKSGKKS